MREAANRNQEGHLGPAELRDEMFQHQGERNAVQRIFGMLLSHEISILEITRLRD